MIDRLHRVRKKAHSAVRESPRRVAVVAVILMLVTAGVAAQTLVVLDDFESGELDGDWSGDTGAYDVQSGDAAEGDYYLSYTGSGANDEIRHGFEENPESVQLYVYPEGQQASTQYNQIRLLNDTGDLIVYMEVDTEQSPAEILNNGEGTGITIPHNEWTEIAISGLDDGDGQHTITANGQTETVDYYSAGDVSQFTVHNSDGSSEVRYDNIRVGASSDTDTLEDESELSLDTRSLFKPNSTHPYTVTLSDVGDVTDNATVTSDNESVLSVDETAHTLSATNDSNTTAVVNVTANYSADGEQYNVTKEVVVAEATVDNLEILPSGTWRTNAVLGDSFFQALLVAMFVGVAMTRFSSAFAGIAGAEMLLVIGWFGGYVPWVYAALGMFVAIFIGLNLAANIDYTVRR